MDLTNMDPTLGAAMVNMASSLSTLVLKGTATAIHGKIESIKNSKDADKIRTTYDEIVNQLLSEREEAVRIAQTYKQELERVVISDEDIEYLHVTISKVLDIVKTIQVVKGVERSTNESLKVIEAIESAKELVSKDVLKTMQLLGFNYRAAIGEPLTKLCADAISSLGASKTQNNSSNRRK